MPDGFADSYADTDDYSPKTVIYALSTSLWSDGKPEFLLRISIMKNLIMLFCLVAFLVALPLSNSVQAKSGEGKKDKCKSHKCEEKRQGKGGGNENIKSPKVKLCHVKYVIKVEDGQVVSTDVVNDDVTDTDNVEPVTIDVDDGTYHFGKEISVANQAVADHEAHGDYVYDEDDDKYFRCDGARETIRKFREAGYKLPGVDCFYFEAAEEDDGGGSTGPIIFG